MNGRSRLPLAIVIGAPLATLLLGGGAGWLLRDTASNNRGTTATAATGAGANLPTDLEALATSRPLPRPQDPVVVDPASIIGIDPAAGLHVPPASALDLPLAPAGNATIVDPETHAPITPPPPSATPPAPAATPTDALPPIAPTEKTVPPPDRAPSSSTTPISATAGFIDTCVEAVTPCAGAVAVVREQATTEQATTEPASALDAFRVTVPVAGAAGYASLCDTVEADAVPDHILTPATRPTVAVFVNQPSTLALTGTWADGSELPKVTMITSPAHDAEWQRSWEQDRVQRNIIACITLPLDDVRAHADGGVAELTADVLAISATGRADATAQVTLNIPTDGDDPLFAERLTIANRGEQLGSDGLLHPTLHVHYAIFTDAAAPNGSGLDPATVHLYDEHAFVEGADCSGWAMNHQGRDRTAGTNFTVVNEQRKVSGRDRNVTSVDGDVSLDPSLPGGWEGHFCVRLTTGAGAASTASGAAPPGVVKVLTLALRGAAVRSPRTPEYAVGVVLADPDYPTDWQLRTSWRRVDTTPLCADAALGNSPSATHGATCTKSARLSPGGIVVSITAIDAAGSESPVLTARVPVNTAYCNPDDPFGYLANGCDHGFSQPLDLPIAVGDDGPRSVRVILQVNRSATAGSLRRDPSQAWAIGTVTSFDA